MPAGTVLGCFALRKGRKKMQGSLGLYTVRISVELEGKKGWGSGQGKRNGLGRFGLGYGVVLTGNWRN
ncbi:hypothetical protein KY284_009705 [Solanum tuberosum]|nr:hypothetical protein KY284_009705 [Solanum tuberosum]